MIETRNFQADLRQPALLDLMDLTGRVGRRYPLRELEIFGGWSPRDDRVAIGSDKTIELLDLASGRRTTLLRLQR